MDQSGKSASAKRLLDCVHGSPDNDNEQVAKRPKKGTALFSIEREPSDTLILQRENARPPNAKEVGVQNYSITTPTIEMRGYGTQPVPFWFPEYTYVSVISKEDNGRCFVIEEEEETQETPTPFADVPRELRPHSDDATLLLDDGQTTVSFRTSPDRPRTSQGAPDQNESITSAASDDLVKLEDHHLEDSDDDISGLPYEDCDLYAGFEHLYRRMGKDRAPGRRGSLVL